MGPLVPDIIGNELNFVIAIFIGMAFGYILEQAGFSTSKKLVGLFYGYDFTVLRVFFTAGVTAMIGVIALAHFGLLDLSLIYINPTFLYSALVGGLIMGLGFVIGGFCPGTSVCAAAIGKIDAMFFVVGSFFGVLAFTEFYPAFEALYKAEAWGFIRIFDTLGMSQALFAFLLTAIAVGAFWFVTYVEKRVNGEIEKELSSKKLYGSLAALALLIGLSAFILPDQKNDILSETTNESKIMNEDMDVMSTDELAFRLIDNDKRVQIFDMRSQALCDSISLPNSLRIKLENIFDKDIQKMLAKRKMISLFVGDNELASRKGAHIARRMGYDGVYVLKGGCVSFKHDILDFEIPEGVTDINSNDTYRFRSMAKVKIAKLIEDYQKNKSPQKREKPKRVLGGC